VTTWRCARKNNGLCYQLQKLTFNLAKLRQRKPRRWIALKLKSTGDAVGPNRNDVLPEFKRRMPRTVQNGMPFRRQHLAEGSLVTSFAGAIQPAFDQPLEHATLPASLALSGRSASLSAARFRDALSCASRCLSGWEIYELLASAVTNQR